MRIWSPILALIVAGTAGDRNTAATWTWTARVVQQSLWPDVLRTDSARSDGVRNDIKDLSRLITAMGVLISIAGVITPLGLYETMFPPSLESAHFQYIPDESPFGYGTPPRHPHPFSRICSQDTYIACPFSDTVVSEDPDGNVSFPHGYDTHVPSVLLDIYSSGTDHNSTVSNYFDIQWRRYATQIDSKGIFDNGSSYPVMAFRPLKSVVLDNMVEPIEGLIVDTVNGSIGFRNHTFPPGFPSGVSWTEDILFIEPETVCVDLNLTLDFTITLGTKSLFADNFVLTDQGGFANLNHTYPEFDQSHPQSNAQLWNRAYKAAMMSNAYTIFYYNVSNPNNQPDPNMRAFAYVDSHVGKTFSVHNEHNSQEYDALKIDGRFLDYYSMFNFPQDNTSMNSTLSNMTTRSPPLGNGTSGSIPANPFGVNSTWFQDLGGLCENYYGDDDAFINHIMIKCGYVGGVPQRQGGGSGLVFDSGSQWYRPMYMCATATKALIKTVTFNYNGTRGLQSLSVTDIQKKTYPGKADVPLWGVENINVTVTTWGTHVFGDNPIWGLIDPRYQGHANVSSVQQEALYLPGISAGIRMSDDQSLPGSDFLVDAAISSYDVGPVSSDDETGLVLPDYSGATQMSMWVRWQELSRSVETASKIINLIWTDFASSAVVGTRGVLGPSNSASANSVSLDVIPFRRRIGYHFIYAIPAFAILLLLLIISVIALITWARSRVSLADLRRQVHRVSTGRILTNFLYPGKSGMDSSSREWSDKMGTVIVEFSRRNVMELEVLSQPPKKDTMTESGPQGEDSLAEDRRLLADAGSPGRITRSYVCDN